MIKLLLLSGIPLVKQNQQTNFADKVNFTILYLICILHIRYVDMFD